MFNRELKVQFVKTKKPKSESADESRTRMTAAELNALVLVNAKYVALIAGAGYAAKKVLDTASEVALIAARSNFK